MVLTIAHRGARSLAPENTMAAIKKAWEAGADGVEVDVGVSGDGVLLLMHDPTLTRTTDVAARFPDRQDHPFTTFSMGELQRLDAGSWFIDTDPFGQLAAGAINRDEAETFHRCTIPTLSELLDFITDKAWLINCELKSMPPPMETFPLAEAVLDAIDRHKVAPAKVVISSFDHRQLDIVSDRRPDIEIQALIGGDPAAGNNWGDYRYRTYNANGDCIDRAQITRAHDKRCAVNLYTVNETEAMRRYIDWGVAGLITDFPQLLKPIALSATR